MIGPRSPIETEKAVLDMQNRVRSVPRILVADDDEAITEMLSTALGIRGFEVVACHTGTQACRILEKQEVDLVLLDLVMPGKNGLDVCKEIKANPDYDQIPVVIMTSITTDGEMADGVWKAGTPADDFISKPFDPFELADRLEKLLSSRPK